jgi:predicted small secreted protein
MKRTSLIPLLITAACVFAAGCGSNPATGGKNLLSVGGEENPRKSPGNRQDARLYDDQATQEYVQIVGASRSRRSAQQRSS